MNETRRKRQGQRHYLFWTTYGILVLSAAVVGAAGGLIFGYTFDLPQVKQLQEIRPNVVSYVYADDERVLGQFALERRILVAYEQIPETVRNALLATEDQNFFRHTGIDFRRLLSALIQDILFWEKKGASTLTMQLSKLRFTSPGRTIERKIKDMLFAIQIEKNFSKEQIFTFYCNQIYLGHGNYGIAAAADFYFDKPLDQLNLSESALIAGILRSPQNYSPINHPQRALRRRSYVLGRMHEEGYLDDATWRAALQESLAVSGKNREEGPAPYFVEWVRQYLEQKYRTRDIWKGGLKIHTTLDYDMQLATRQALREGLKKFDKETHGWKGPIENILDQGKDMDEYFHPDWGQIFYEGQMIQGLVQESGKSQAQVKLGTYSARIGPKQIEWTGQKRVDRLLKRGDIAVFSIEKINRSEKLIEANLDQIPEVQGAVLGIENKTGAIKSMVGGFDFQRSKFNRATQALRQAGSTFKVFTYVAAMEEGYTPFDTVLDAPKGFRDGLGRLYAPTNSDGKFKGLIPIRQALAQSRNVPTLRLANALGIEKVIAVARRFGISREFPPYLPIALGAGELTLQEMTSTFSVFPNNGVRARPYFVKRVEDYQGITLEEYRHQMKEVISTETAGQMVFLLQGVIERGTASRARVLGRPLGGKTGTTNESTDSWFVGFTPRLTAGVWVGYDQKKSLGERVFGATLALPIWLDFMKVTLQDEPLEDFETTFTPTLANVHSKKETEEAEGEGEKKEGEKEEEKEVRSGVIEVEDILPPGTSIQENSAGTPDPQSASTGPVESGAEDEE